MWTLVGILPWVQTVIGEQPRPEHTQEYFYAQCDDEMKNESIRVAESGVNEIRSDSGRFVP
jgi:hypothetical protein